MLQHTYETTYKGAFSMPKDKVLTVEDIAEYLKLRPITVRQMFRNGKLRGFKVGKSWRTTETIFFEDVNRMAKKFGLTIPKETERKAKTKKETQKTSKTNHKESRLSENHRKKSSTSEDIALLFNIDEE